MKTHQALPKDTSLTNQEFSAYLRQHQSQQQKTFALLVKSAEPVLYGNQIPSKQSLSYCWVYAERILA